MVLRKLLPIFLCSLLLGSISLYAQNQEEDTKSIYKAAYLFSFTKLVDWPRAYKQGDFTIGLLVDGDSDNLYKELRKKYQDKRIGNQTIDIKKYSSADDVGSRCNILFIGKEETSSLSQLKSEDRSTLLVSERQGALRRGAVINFVIKNNQLEYELSRGNAKKYGLTVGNQLQELAYKVH